MLSKRRAFQSASTKRKRSNGDSISRVKRIKDMQNRAFRNRQLLNLRSGGLLGVELKFLDAPRTSLALTAPTDAAGGEINPSSIVTGCLSAPAQGDGPTNRDGHKIVVKSILVQGSFSNAIQQDQADADVMPTLFVALVLDTQTNGATLNSEDVFTNPAADADCNGNLPRNMSFTSRFKVLKTFHMSVPQLILGADGGRLKPTP